MLGLSRQSPGRQTTVGAHLVHKGLPSVARDALAARPKRRAFVCLRQPRYFSFACPRRTQERARTAKPARRAQGRTPGVKEKYPRENDTPLGACWASGNRSCVASTPASMPSPALAKRSRHPCRLPLRGLSPHLTAAQGPRVEQRAILARTRCATAARLREQKASSSGRSFDRGGSLLSASFGDSVCAGHWNEADARFSAYRQSRPVPAS